MPLKLIGSTTRRPSLHGEETIRHLSSANVGGALLITPEAYRKVNGYSNNFGGWGKEDDNMAWRLRNGLKSEFVGGYRVLTDSKFRELYHDRVWGLDTNQQMKHNAAMERELVSGLRDVDYYKVVNVTQYSVDGWGVTRFLVEPTPQAAATAAGRKTRAQGPDKGPRIGNTCNDLFAHNSMYWTSNGTCLNHRVLHWKSCHIGTLFVNTSQIIGSVGGEPLESVWNRSDAVEVLKFQRGALQITTELDFLKNFYKLSGWTGALENVITQGASTSTGLERVIVQPASPGTRPMTNLLVRRGDYANPCMTVASLYNVYLIMQKFNVVPPYRIIWLDGHAQGVLDPVWSQLFEGGEIVHMKQLSPSEQRFDNTILVNVKNALGDEGLKHHKFADACNASSSTLEEFRNFVLNRYGIAHSDDSNTKKDPSHKKLLTLLVRKHHRAHPRATGRTDRTLANVTDDVQYLQSTYPNHQIDVVSFEEMSFGDQLKQIAKTDVFVAVHGAGNIHVLFLPPDARFVEYVPKGFSHRIRFKYLANCLNITYVLQSAKIVERHVDKTMTVRLRPGRIEDDDGLLREQGIGGRHSRAVRDILAREKAHRHRGAMDHGRLSAIHHHGLKDENRRGRPDQR
jgi:N-terminal domain of galactosyltransferase/Glycosyltransferase 61